MNLWGGEWEPRKRNCRESHEVAVAEKGRSVGCCWDASKDLSAPAGLPGRGRLMM